MKNIKEKWLIYRRLIMLSIGIVLLPSANPIRAEEIDAKVLGKVETITPQASDPVTVFFVSPFGDSISRTVDIGNTLQNNLRAFHTTIIIGFGAGEVKFKVSGNEDDEVLFASLGASMGADDESNLVSKRLFGYAESDGEYTLTFSTESIATAVIVTVPVYPVGHWSAPITLKLTVSME